MSEIVALAIGSNIGDRLAALKAAAERLAPQVVITHKSHVYETAAAYVTDQPAFLNAVLLGTTDLEPLPLLYAVKSLEKSIGRLPSFRYGPRMIDIDILFHGQNIVSLPDLTVPHMRMTERDFVLRPLNDVVPNWQHPLTKQNVTQMLNALPQGTMQDLGPLL